MKGIKKRLALFLALFLALQPISPQGAEALYMEITDAEFGDVETEEIQIDGEGFSDGAKIQEQGEEPGQKGEEFFSGEELFLDQAIDREKEVFQETGEEVLLSSPFVVTLEDPARPQFRMFSLEEYGRSYGEQLEGQSRQIYDKIVDRYVKNSKADYGNSLKKEITFEKILFQPTIDENTGKVLPSDERREAENLLKASAQAAIDAFSYDYPQVFWMRGAAYSYKIEYCSDGSTAWLSGLTFSPQVIYDSVGDDASAKAVMAKFEAGVDKALEEIQGSLIEGSARYDQVKAVEEYVCKAVDYDKSGAQNLLSHCAGPVFLGEGNVVCEGYAKAVKILCDRMDIPCACVSGGARSILGGALEPHMWNYVQMDNGRWYLVDATWDDGEIKRENYLLAGLNSVGAGGLSIKEERTEKNTFSSPEGKGYEAKAFTYPSLASISYVQDKEEACAHEWDVNVQEPTCTKEGVQITICKRCGYKKEQKAIPALGHDFSVKEEKSATCTEKGIRLFACTRCGEQKEEITGPALGHNFSAKEEKSATCTEKGTTLFACTRCGEQKEEITGPALGHNFSVKEEKSATCTEKGIRLFSCTRCGEQKEEITGPALGHRLTFVPEKAATCTKEGNIAHYFCQVCKELFSDTAGRERLTQEQTVINPTGHSFGEYQVTKEPTVLKEGEEMSVCSCGEIRTRPIARLDKELKVNVSSLRLKVKQSYTIKVTKMAKGDEVKSFQSSNKKIAKVDKKGKVTGLKKGSAVITLTLESGIRKKIKVTVQTSPVKTKKLTVNKTKVSLKQGKTYRLRTFLSPVTSAQKVKYKSSNKKVAKVTGKGVIKARKKGTAVITVQSGSKKKKVKVYVK